MAKWLLTIGSSIEGMHKWVGIIIAVIGIVSIIKIITLISENRHASNRYVRNQNTENRTDVNRNQRTVPVRSETVPQNRATETGPMIYYANTQHKRIDREYRFNYKKVNGSWRAYILRMPSLGNRDSSGVVTHRLYDNGRPYVCWDSTVNSLKDMQIISRVWADSIQEYIATGRRFG